MRRNTTQILPAPPTSICGPRVHARPRGLREHCGAAVADLPARHGAVTGAPLPLHIFEPRYRALVDDVWGRAGTAATAAGFGIVSMTAVAAARSRTGPAARRSRPAPSRPKRRADRRRRLATVGTFASIIEVEPYEDGRSDLSRSGGALSGARTRTGRQALPAGPRRLAARRARRRSRTPWPRPPAPVLALPGRTGRTGRARTAGGHLRRDPITLSYQLAGRMRLANSERQGLLEAATAAERLRTALRLLRREIVLMTRTRTVPVSPGAAAASTPDPIDMRSRGRPRRGRPRSSGLTNAAQMHVDRRRQRRLDEQQPARVDLQRQPGDVVFTLPLVVPPPASRPTRSVITAPTTPPTASPATVTGPRCGRGAPDDERRRPGR